MAGAALVEQKNAWVSSFIFVPDEMNTFSRCGFFSFYYKNLYMASLA